MLLNRLAQETSPYLQQHANNPVDWYPWGPEALEKAKQENKPILLSIGYSACHWCHVMAHESFADQPTAQLMNELFVNIKVDREERPDLDKIYQTLNQLLTDKPGGWPLTVFLTPLQHLPFFTGTYFPKEPHYHLPAFKDILQQVASFYQQHQQDIDAQGQGILASLNQSVSLALPNETYAFNLKPWQSALQHLAADFDPLYGGFGRAPKFPNPTYLELLITECIQNRPADLAPNHSWQMVKKTLTKMALGGIYDQIGGGFYRYATDERWEIPHFEKMLYNNAQLLALYAQAYALAPDPLFKKIITETAAWVISDMQATDAGYYSSIDADSEGKEGLYYLWTPPQVKSLVSESEYAKLLTHFNLHQPANFDGDWHLYVTHTAEQLAKTSQESLTDIEAVLRSGREKLHASRGKRIHPLGDEKILTAWNSLMIKGMALAGVQLQQPSWLDSAERSLQFIYNNLWREGRLLATAKDGRAHLAAYLDDYAFLLDAIITLLQYRWSTAHLLFAMDLAEVLLTHFSDPQQGGFFFVADDHETLIYRPKTFVDGVMPAGMGIACHTLQRLGYLLGESRYLSCVENALKAAWPAIQQNPAAHSSLLLALREYLSPPQIIVIRAKPPELEQWQSMVHDQQTGHTLAFAIDQAETDLPAGLMTKTPLATPVAYACQGLQCLPAIKSLAELQGLLQHSASIS